MRRTVRITIFLCACIAMGRSISNAQLKEAISPLDLSSLKSSVKPSLKDIDTRTFATDGPVNPKDYYVGAGDVIGVNVWSTSPTEYRLVVTPEGSLLVPNVGEVIVRGHTLEEVKQEVSKVVARKYTHAEVTVTLVSPRMITVEIMGHVLSEGKKEVTALQRTDNLIALSNTFPSDRLTVEDYGRELDRLRRSYSERKTVIRGRDGTVTRVDLPKYRATGENRFNPYLREGDVVYVPERWDMNNTIAVFNALMSNANFEFIEGDSLSGLVTMALGTNSETEPEHAYLARLGPDGNTMDSVEVNLRNVKAGTASDIALRPGDRLVIPKRVDPRANYRVTISGEVAHEGTYPITRSHTRLSEVIRQSGGVTTMANLFGATLRRYPSGNEGSGEHMEFERLLAQRASLHGEDTSYYGLESALRANGSFVRVNFERLLVGGDTTQDVIVEPDDQIIIPTRRQSIFVYGQVVSPGEVPLVSGKSYDYYIEKAGGFADDARAGDVRVIKGGTRVWLDPGQTTIEDGDFLWVPKDIYRPASYYLVTYSQVAGIAVALATLVVLSKTIK